MVSTVGSKEQNNRNTEDAIYFNFSYAALKLLGKNLYNSAANAISELVANSLDAKARKVYVYIDMSDKEHSIIEIIDNGTGMDYSDLAEKYVWIGRNKRNDVELSADEKQSLMGRKGIGKLAALYLSNQYCIFTKKADGLENRWEVNLSKYEDSEFPKLDRLKRQIILVNNLVWERFDCGTAIKLENVDLRRNGEKKIEALRRVFADFYLLDALTATIYVAVKKQKHERVEFKPVQKKIAYKNFYALFDNSGHNIASKMSKSMAFTWASPYNHIAMKQRETQLLDQNIYVTNGEYEHQNEDGTKIKKSFCLTGWIGIHATIEQNNAIDENFIRNTVYQPNRLRLYVRNKLAVSDYFSISPSTQAMANYIEGEISFDILDDNELPDIATSSRQDFLDDERIKLLIKIVDPILTKLFSLRNKIGKQINDENDAYKNYLINQEKEKRIKEEKARKKAEEKVLEAEQKRNEAEREKQVAENRAEKLSMNLGSEKKRNHFLVNSLDDDQINFAKRLHMIRINASTIAKVVKNNVNKLKRGKFSEKDAWDLLKKISYLSARMQAVLEYSAMAKFNTKEEFIEDNLFDFIEEYCENVLAQDEEIKIEIQRKDEKGVNLRFIPQDIAVVLDNIISNSTKFNATLIKIILNKENEFYTIDFIDNGDGLDPRIEDVSELFEFGKGYTFTGTGVGLYHIKSIVEKELKGTVRIIEDTKGFDLQVRFKKL